MINKLDKANAEFWNELCGSGLAKQLGITEHSKDSIDLFDRAYLGFYPYLLDHIDIESIFGKSVLEVGLGYGTLGQILSSKAKWYQGLDISPGPVKMMNFRIDLFKYKGKATQGSALSMPFRNDTFDRVISIGCFHHTGDAKKCIDETFRVLRPNGSATIMLYNRYSYRQWIKWPIITTKTLLNEYLFKDKRPNITEDQRRAYDANSDGNAAPETDFFSGKEILKMFEYFSKVKLRKENCDSIGSSLLGISLSRDKLLPYLGNSVGLDYYIEAVK